MWHKLSIDLTLPDTHFLATKAQIQASHDACRRMGVKSGQAKIIDVLPNEKIEALLSQCSELSMVARSLFMETYQYFTHRSAIFMMTDRDARVIGLHSVAEVICNAADAGLRIGTSLADMSCGTNAVSLALRHKHPIVVKSQQHYCDLFHNWCCAAAPILDAMGEVVGCINLCDHASQPLGEKLALVVLLAKTLSWHNGSDSLLTDEILHTTVIPHSVQISSRQRETLRLLTTGKTYKQIGVELGISTRTVESHIEKLRRKYGARTTAQLIALVTMSNSVSTTLTNHNSEYIAHIVEEQ